MKNGLNDIHRNENLPIMLKRFNQHLILAFVFFTMTLLQQYLFYSFKGLPIVFFTLPKYLGMFVFFLAATFTHGPHLRYFFLSFVLFLNFFQMSHLSYFGTQILPSEFYLLVSQFYEITGTLKEELRHIFVPLAFTAVPLILGWFISRKMNMVKGLRTISVLFILYLFYNPVRTYITGNTWGRQPSTRELAGMNVYLSLSYFSGRILPIKLKGRSELAQNSSTLLRLDAQNPPRWDKIVFVLGESLTPHHMQLFGYGRPTTPFLMGLRDQNKFIHRVALSSGVSTDISVAFFMNFGFGSAGALKATKGEHCLFKLAKSQGLATHFLSMQSAQQLRYITPYLCSPSLDEYKELEQISPGTLDHMAARDRDILPTFQKVLDKTEKQFIVLHLRGSHAPWNLRATSDSKKFLDDNEVDHYDNSVIEFDLLWKDLYHLISARNERILLVFLSDHGEALGEGGRWGHGFLNRRSFEVPFMAMAFNQELSKEFRSLPAVIPSYNVSLAIAQELGLKPNQDPTLPVSDFVIYGNDIDGLAGKAEIFYKDDGDYDFKLSHD